MCTKCETLLQAIEAQTEFVSATPMTEEELREDKAKAVAMVAEQLRLALRDVGVDPKVVSILAMPTFLAMSEAATDPGELLAMAMAVGRDAKRLTPSQIEQALKDAPMAV